MTERKVKVSTEIALKLFIFTSGFFLKLLTLGSLKFGLLQWTCVFPSSWQVVTMPARRLRTCSCGRSFLCAWQTPWGKSICCLIICWTGLRLGWYRVGKFKRMDWKIIVKLTLCCFACNRESLNSSKSVSFLPQIVYCVSCQMKFHFLLSNVEYIL